MQDSAPGFRTRGRPGTVWIDVTSCISLWLGQ